MSENAAQTGSLIALPSRSLLRPDRNGQLPHIFLTLESGTPVTELALEDILDVNWNGVRSAIQDALTRVRHEGDLSSSTVRDAIRLLGVALSKLDVMGEELDRRMHETPGLGLLGWLVSQLPTVSGRRLKKIGHDRKRARRQRRALRDHHDEMFSKRIELAGAIDAKIDAHLLGTDAEYRREAERLVDFEAPRRTAKAILADLAMRAQYDIDWQNPYANHGVLRQKMAGIDAKFPSFLQFCKRNGGPVKEYGDMSIFLTEFLAGLDAKAKPIEAVLAAKREAMKRAIYADAEAAVP